MNVLVVSPHPDDETLGAGGTILKLKKEGNNIFWLNITAMTEKNFSRETIDARKIQMQEIREFFGFTKSYSLDFPSTELDTIDSAKAIAAISDIVNEVQPNILILPDYNDAHSDHKNVFDWCYACSKVFRYPYIKQIMTMEIVSETDFGRPENPFNPNYYVDITEYIDEKLKALKIYDTEMGIPPFPRSEDNIRSLARVRGATAGTCYAEAFRLIKYIDK